MNAIPEQVVEPFFADTGHGRRFAIANRPSCTARGGVLFVHPFAEEMNKSRRMAAMMSRALAKNGWLVLRCDLQGCGDSEGDFGEATWEGWQDDLTFWTNWLRMQTDGPVVQCGLRLGALLSASWVATSGVSLPLLFWQPITNGQRCLTQFLRLRAVAQMLDSRESTGVVSDLLATLATGSPVTVAGYTLHPELANPMAAARLRLPEHYSDMVSVIEVTSSADGSPSPALKNLVDKWNGFGVDARLAVINGPPFWQTVEIQTVPDLITMSTEQLSRLEK